MEGVLTQPELLARLEAPDDPTAWQFAPPSGVEWSESCPPTLSCRGGGEFFRTTWLDAQGEAGALGDSVGQVHSAPVYAQRGDQARLAGFCGLEEGAVRTMLLLPAANIEAAAPLPQFFEASNEESEVDAPPMTLAQHHVLAWAVRQGAPVYLGACDHLQEFLPSALALEAQEGDGELRVLVDLAAAGDPNAVAISADGAVPIEGIQRAVAVEGLAGGALGLGQAIVHDSACPGNYVMGLVVNHEGAPMAGVRLVMTDAWGNQTSAVSKNGQGDYGMFDFPIYGDGPQNLQLSVVDENNNPRGAPFIVPHKMDAASSTPCHHVVIRGD
jgi:hypothetical protein